MNWALSALRVVLVVYCPSEDWDGILCVCVQGWRVSWNHLEVWTILGSTPCSDREWEAGSPPHFRDWAQCLLTQMLIPCYILRPQSRHSLESWRRAVMQGERRDGKWDLSAAQFSSSCCSLESLEYVLAYLCPRSHGAIQGFSVPCIHLLLL